MPFRDETETLRAQLADAHAEIARMTAKPAGVPTRWGIAWNWIGEAGAGVAALFLGLSVVGWVVGGERLFRQPEYQRLSVVMGVAAIAWCLVFVRRVPR